MEVEMKNNVVRDQVTNRSDRDEAKVANPRSFGCTEFSLRLLALATTLTSALVMGLAKETKIVPFEIIPGTPPVFFPVPAKMRYSSAFVYFVVANAIACAYAALSLMAKMTDRAGPTAMKLTLMISDLIMVGLLFSGNGAAAAVGVIGFKGNSHVRWNKICDTFDKFCNKILVSLIVSLIGSLIFLLLIVYSTFNLHKRSRCAI